MRIGSNWYNMVGRRVAVNINGEDKPGVIISYHDIAEAFTVSVYPFDGESVMMFPVDNVELIEPTDSRSEIDRKDDEIKALRSKLDEQEETIRFYTIELKDQDGEISMLNHEKSRLNEHVDRGDEAIRSYLGQIEALKVQASTLNSEINALKDDVACKSGALNYMRSQCKRIKDEDDKPDEYDDFLIFPSNDHLCVGIDGVSVAILDAMNDKDFIGFVWGCDSDNPVVESDPFRLSTDHDGFEVCDALRFRRK